VQSIDGSVVSLWMPYRDISGMQSRTALFRIGYTSHIASYTDRSLDNFGWAEHPADLAEIASLEGLSLLH
jgi:hypothetical protein